MNGTTVKGNYTSAESYAETVVKNVMKRNPRRRIWVGGVVGAIWFVSTFLWATAWVSERGKGKGENEANENRIGFWRSRRGLGS